MNALGFVNYCYVRQVSDDCQKELLEVSIEQYEDREVMKSC